MGILAAIKPRYSALSVAMFLLQACANQAGTANAPTDTNRIAYNRTSANTTNTNKLTYKMEGVDYPTAAAALDAQRQLNQKILDPLDKTTDPIKGQARIIVPDLNRLRPLATQQLQSVVKSQIPSEFVNYYIAVQQNALRALADSLAKNGTFESVEIIEQNDVLNPDIGNADYLVWYQVRTTQPNYTGPWIGNWLVRRSNNAATAQAAVDVGTGPGLPRYVSFINSVRGAAQRLSGSPASGIPGQAGRGPTSPAGAQGSGFIIDTHGSILTNEHVVHICPELHITDAANQTYSGTIVAKDAANDLALVRAAHHWQDAAAFHGGHELRPGDAVIVTGYPLSGLVGSGVAVTTGSITTLTGPRDDSRLLQFSAPIQPGNSGGPVLDGGGRVIGVATSTLNGMVLAIATGVVPQNINFAVKTSIIRNFLDAHNIAYTHTASTRELSPGDVGDIARKFTVRIECRKQ